MNLYLIERTDKWSYDDYDAAVVIAADEESARSTHPNPADEWGWPINLQNVKVTLLGVSNSDTPGVVLNSFNAG